MIIAKLQAAFYILTGLWAVLDIRNFEAITGPKVDKWLVKVIAWLFIVIGLQLWFVNNPDDYALLGLGSALVIGIADIYYSLVKKQISKVYTLDALIEFIFVVGWIVVLRV